MTAYNEFIRRRREEAWSLGIAHRENLVAHLMQQFRLKQRPLLKDAIDDLLVEIQRVRLRYDPLPDDAYAQTEAVNGRLEVTINSRIASMPNVKDVEGVIVVSKWHESGHVAWHFPETTATAQLIGAPPLPGFELSARRRIVCRSIAPTPRFEKEREFLAENAARAAAIDPHDLTRCDAYHEYVRRVSRGGDLGPSGWQILADIAGAIGVNRTVLTTYFEQRGWHQVIEEDGRRRLVASPQLALDAFQVRLDRTNS